jgi:predicted transcriptional regulator
MERTRLEEYLVIVNTLVQNGPLKLSRMTDLTSLDRALLQERLYFLVHHGIIKKRAENKQTCVYNVSERGLKIVNFFHFGASAQTNSGSLIE